MQGEVACFLLWAYQMAEKILIFNKQSFAICVKDMEDFRFL